MGQVGTVCLIGLVSPILVHDAKAEALPIALSPVRFEFGSYPEQKLSGVLEFWNGTNEFLPIQVEVDDFEPQGEEGHVAVSGADTSLDLSSGMREVNRYSLKDWISLDFPSLAVAPKEKIKLDFQLNVPKTALPGSYWGTILVRAVPGAGDGSAIQASAGAIVLLTVFGEADELLSVESFVTSHVAASVPVVLTARFRNDGDVFVKPKGNVRLYSMFGSNVTSVALPEWNVLPGSARKFEIHAGGSMHSGRYIAELHATYGREKTALSAKTVFWVVNWKTDGPPFLAALGLFLFAIWKRKNLKAAFHILRTGETPSQVI